MANILGMVFLCFLIGLVAALFNMNIVHVIVVAVAGIAIGGLLFSRG
jgi:hypothetical protein